MSDPASFEPSAGSHDPRLDPGFQPEHWPLCNGAESPAPVAPDLHSRRCIEFLALFYRLNVLNSQLHAARLVNSAQDRIKAILDQIATVTETLEATEDRYAPIGFFGEPLMDGIRYSNVIFVRPEVPRVYQKPDALSSHIAIPGLEEIPESELQGPARLLRFGHGKVDL
jgi:hypothetical protein